MGPNRRSTMLGRGVPVAVVTLVLLSAAGRPMPASALCTVEPAAELVHAQARFNLGCATAPPTATWTAEQFFERGVMLWREDWRMIYVLSADGSWRQYHDHFYDGQTEQVGHYPPLPWLREPVRGFGLIWRERLGGPGAAIGWATNDEQGWDATIQVFENGLVVRNAAGRVFILLKDRTWRRP